MSPVFCQRIFCTSTPHTEKKNRELVLTLPCSGVSLDNSSFPRGLFFHDNSLRVVRLHFKSLGERHDSVYATSPYTQDDVVRVLNEIQNTDISREQQRILTSLVKDIFDRHDQYERKTFDEQMVRVNWLLPKYIPGYEHVEHISIGQEILVRELLLLHLESDTYLSHLLLDADAQTLYTDAFEGIVGAHTIGEHKGTHMFWGLDEAGVRIQLTMGPDGWHTREGALFLARDKDSLVRALTERTIYPSMALTFIVLAFVHGITCGGGFSQINYLGDMKKAFEKLETALGWKSIALPETNIFTGELVVNVLEKDGQTVPATLVDTILYQDDTTATRLSQAYSTTTFKDALWAMMPEYYKIITGTAAENIHFPLPPATLHVKRDISL
jgi:hypothetical protein